MCKIQFKEIKHGVDRHGAKFVNKNDVLLSGATVQHRMKSSQTQVEIAPQFGLNDARGA